MAKANTGPTTPARSIRPAPDPLPEVDQATLQEALATAEASLRETDPVIRGLLEEEALRLWAAAHQARRDAMYARGRQ